MEMVMDGRQESVQCQWSLMYTCKSGNVHPSFCSWPSGRTQTSVSGESVAALHVASQVLPPKSLFSTQTSRSHKRHRVIDYLCMLEFQTRMHASMFLSTLVQFDHPRPSPTRTAAHTHTLVRMR